MMCTNMSWGNCGSCGECRVFARWEKEAKHEPPHVPTLAQVEYRKARNEAQQRQARIRALEDELAALRGQE